MTESSNKARSQHVQRRFVNWSRDVRVGVWPISGIAVLLTLAAVGWSAAEGDRKPYEAGPVTEPHRFIENDCGKCHVEWGPARRLWNLVTFSDERVYSISKEKCEACHSGAVHHPNQSPMHAGVDLVSDLSCADCHREHRGHVDLARISNAHCIRCHGDLPAHATETADRPSPPPYAARITGFDEAGGHPEFAIHRLLSEAGSELPEPAGDRPGPVLDHFARPAERVRGESGSAGPRRQDPGRIRFNHAAHLRRPLPVTDDAENAARWGDRRRCYEIDDEEAREAACDDSRMSMVQLECGDCHRPDASREYMQPIDYTAHCRVCHPLRFDDDPSHVIPHAAASAAARAVPLWETKARKTAGVDVVRGYLAEVLARNLVSDREDDPLAGVPGLPPQSLLTARERERLRTSIAGTESELLRELTDADLAVLQSARNVLAEESRGGCRLCHQVEDVEDEPGKTTWGIEPTRIPERWFRHSRFSHDSHRELDCAACHRDFHATGEPAEVESSWSTGDVLLPTIDVCRRCHSPQATVSGGAARSDCVECHVYHDRTRERSRPKERMFEDLFSTSDRR